MNAAALDRPALDEFAASHYHCVLAGLLRVLSNKPARVGKG